MGRPKALLPFDGEPLVAHIARALGRLFPEVVVVAAPGEEFVGLLGLLGSQPDDTNEPDQPNERKNPNQLNQPEIRVVVDEVAHQGPVGGIYYGLGAAGGDFSFVTSCDAAFLNSALIE
ncbi:MAG TPA: NTP transferase domain-containing protein, partial [Candidatus Binatia bacterium]